MNEHPKHPKRRTRADVVAEEPAVIVTDISINLTEPRARVREIDGQLVLDDPDALAMIKAVARHNCRLTFENQVERVAHFKSRIAEKCLSPNDVVIVLLNVNDSHGKMLADILMPGQDAMWQSMRDEGQIPFARGLAGREGIETTIATLDQEIGKKLRAMKDKVAAVVVDHGVVEAFEV